MNLTLSDPVIVSQAAPDVRAWGPWQFPLLTSLADGRILLEYHREADSAQAYGLPVGQSVSGDAGRTWQAVDPPGMTAGLRLPDGDELRAIQLPSIPAAELDLPAPFAHVHSSYPLTYTYYWRGDLPPELQSGFWFRRKAAGSSAWVDEQARVEQAGLLACVSEGVLVVPFFEQDRIRLAPDGRLLATLYAHPHIAGGRTLVRRYLAMLLESTDGGRAWGLKSTIPYFPNPRADPSWDARDGFSEPQIAFLPDGSLFALLRTHDGNGNGPLYSARSADGGLTWEQPAVFDSFGVWPQLCVLFNGVTLAAYGRPGLFVRATQDPAGRRWGPRKTLVPTGEMGRDTCSYSSLLPLSASSALIAYSDFNVPDAQGRPCKTILVRTVTVSR